jgi:hypothetical protein
LPWSKQIPTRDFRSQPGSITLAKLAKNIAKMVERFIKVIQALPPEVFLDIRSRQLGGLGESTK